MHKPAVATIKTKIKTELGFVIIQTNIDPTQQYFEAKACISVKTKAKCNRDKKFEGGFRRY